MIKNERQYRITQAQAAIFEKALATLQGGEGADAPLDRLQESALRSQLRELRDELADFDRLRSGTMTTLEAESFDDFPQALIKARIAAGLTQRQLAERLGLKEQQIQRYEASDYASVSLERVRSVVRALGIQVREEILLPQAPRRRSFDRKAST